MAVPTLKPAPNWRYRAFLAAYSGLLAAGEPLIWRYFRRRAKADPAYMEAPEDRRGQGDPFVCDLWVHAVSLGEFTSAAPLIRIALEAGYRVLTTHATPAGRNAARAAFNDHPAFAARYMPIDRPRYWRNFFASAQPKAGLVMEVEFWPVMIDEARRAGCLLCLANSQVPSKTFPRARRLAALAGHPVAHAAGVFAKSEPIADRFRQLGASPVLALGETRFDIPAPEHLLTAARALDGPRKTLTLASVVAGEEGLYLDLVTRMMAMPDPPRVIWVPRAPERFEDHARLLEDAGLSVLRRTDAFDDALTPTQDLADTQVLLGNSMREMFFYLAPADAVIVGGGFTEKGAHNVIEPLSLGKPVITGPYTWTIEYPAVEAEAADVLTVVSTPDTLFDAVTAALQAGAAASEFHRKNTGASGRIFDAIRPALEGRP